MRRLALLVLLGIGVAGCMTVAPPDGLDVSDTLGRSAPQAIAAHPDTNEKPDGERECLLDGRPPFDPHCMAGYPLP